VKTDYGFGIHIFISRENAPTGEGLSDSNPCAKPGKRSFVESMDLGPINRIIWLLLAAFVVLGFLDALTTLIAYSHEGFVELNSFAAAFFKLGLRGFLLGVVTKFLPVFPLTYMAALRPSGGPADVQVGLLKLAAFVVLIVGDINLSWIVLVNNIPHLIGVKL